MSKGNGNDGRQSWVVINERRQESSTRRAAICSTGMLFDPAFNIDEQAAMTQIAQQAAREEELLQFETWCQRDLQSLTTDSDIVQRLAKIEAEEQALPPSARGWISKSKASLSNLAGKLGLGSAATAAATAEPLQAAAKSGSSLAKRQLKSLSRISQAMARMTSSPPDSATSSSSSKTVISAAAAAAAPRGQQQRASQALLPPFLMLTARRRNSYWKVVTDMEEDEEEEDGFLLESPLPPPLAPRGVKLPLVASPDPYSLPPIFTTSPSAITGDSLLHSSSQRRRLAAVDSINSSTGAHPPVIITTSAGSITSPGQDTVVRCSPWSEPGSVPPPDPFELQYSAIQAPAAANGRGKEGLSSELGSGSRVLRRMDTTPLPAQRGRTTPSWREIVVAARTGHNLHTAATPCAEFKDPAGGQRFNRSATTI